MSIIFFAIILGSCASTQQIQGIRLHHDLTMPFYGINDVNSPKEYEKIKRISVSSLLPLKDIHLLNHPEIPLRQEMCKQAALYKANTVIGVKIEKEDLFKMSQFGEKKRIRKYTMQGWAILDPNHNKKYLNSYIYDAFIAKYSSDRGNSALKLFIQELDKIENSIFTQDSYGNIKASLFDPSGRQHLLHLSNEELTSFSRKKPYYSYRHKNTEVSVDAP